MALFSYFFTKMDFGTIQWTPLRMSTIWVMSQSTVIDVSVQGHHPCVESQSPRTDTCPIIHRCGKLSNHGKS